MADRYLLESGSPDGYLLEDSSGVLSIDSLYPTALEITNNNNTTVAYQGSGAYQITKTGGTAAADAGAVSSSAIAGDFVLRVGRTAFAGTGQIMLGVNTDPLTNDDISTIDFAYITSTGIGGGWQIWESNVQLVTGLADNTYCFIWRTGTTLGYGRGADLATAQASPDRTTTTSATLYFDSSFYGIGDAAEALFYSIATTSVALTGQALSSAAGSVGATISNALTGQAATTARGTLTPTNALAITGQSVTAAQGQVLQGAPLVGQSLTAAQGSASLAVSIALTGQSVSTARGSVTPTASLAITGQTTTATQGSLTPSLSPAITGQAVTVARGSLLADTSLSLSGQALTAACGTIAPTFVATLAGQSLITDYSAVVVAGSNDVTAALTGLALFIAQGSVTGRTLTSATPIGWREHTREADTWGASATTAGASWDATTRTGSWGGNAQGGGASWNTKQKGQSTW